MKSFLTFIRKAFNIGFIILFVGILLLAIPLSTISSNATNEQTLKNWLNYSNFYDNLYDHAIYIVELEPEDEKKDGGGDKVTLAEKIAESGLFTAGEVTAAFRQAIPPEFVQQQVESVIGSFYSFAEGDEELSFTFGFEDRAKQVAAEAKKLFGDKLSELPVCSAQDTLRMQSEDEEFNPLTADCRPPGNVQREVNKFIDELVSDDGPFGETLTQDDVEIDESDIESIRRAYSAADNSGLVFLALLAILLGLIVATSKPWYRALLPTGIATVLVGVLMVVGFGLGSAQSDSINLNDSDLSARQKEAAEQLILPVVNTAAKDVAAEGILFGVLAVLAGTGMILTEHIMKKRHKSEHPKTILDDDYEEGSEKDKGAKEAKDEPGKDNETQPEKESGAQTKAKPAKAAKKTSGKKTKA